MIWQPEFTDKTLSRKTGAVQSLPCAICSFCTRTGESHSTGFISPDASLNTAGVFIYKQKGKPIIMEWTPRP
ncbi:hypothetical protein GRW41_07740 [Escherichia coli]|nr:hypothetical protein [Escherichia coli]TJP41822.1 hypothetical protein C9Z85_07285 [Escherichia coli]